MNHNYHGLLQGNNDYSTMLPSNKFIRPTYYPGNPTTTNKIVKQNSRIYPQKIEGVQETQRKFIDFTPDSKEFNFPKFEHKVTVSLFKNNLNDDSDKENSNLKFNKEKSPSSHEDDGYFMTTKPGLENNLKSIRINLQSTFSKDSNSELFSRGPKFVNKTLISSSSSSQTEKTVISDANSLSNSQESNKNSYTSEENIKNLNENLIPCNSQSLNTQQTISDTFLEGFSKKNTIKIPVDKINDEKYKLLQIKKIRKSTFKDNKSSSKIDTYSEENLHNLDFFNIRRIKQHHSVKRTYKSEILFTDPLSFKQHKFNIYKDSDIGMDSKWQSYIRESYADEDVPSDDETISHALKHNYIKLWEAIAQIKNKETDQINNISIRNT